MVPAMIPTLSRETAYIRLCRFGLRLMVRHAASMGVRGSYVTAHRTAASHYRRGALAAVLEHLLA